ncbi:RHS repeat-associated core domain-containing protein [Bremerella sp. JC770]|uniref:RHS repeat-associated core domain-containing protein n=1 Tax=Bremerella sp. JC770 TaxID=3232137 RepID=UPI00345942F3
MFDYVDSHQDFPSEPDTGDEITFTADLTFGFTGRDRDADEELHYNRARYYDATPGRWISKNGD